MRQCWLTRCSDSRFAREIPSLPQIRISRQPQHGTVFQADEKQAYFLAMGTVYRSTCSPGGFGSAAFKESALPNISAILAILLQVLMPSIEFIGCSPSSGACGAAFHLPSLLPTAPSALGYKHSKHKMRSVLLGHCWLNGCRQSCSFAFKLFDVSIKLQCF